LHMYRVVPLDHVWSSSDPLSYLFELRQASRHFFDLHLLRKGTWLRTVSGPVTRITAGSQQASEFFPSLSLDLVRRLLSIVTGIGSWLAPRIRDVGRIPDSGLQH
jgi:hypothetical protein